MRPSTGNTTSVNARVDIEGDNLVVTMHGFDVVWTFRRRIVVPLEHVNELLAQVPSGGYILLMTDFEPSDVQSALDMVET